jgi:hypothetical protein
MTLVVACKAKNKILLISDSFIGNESQNFKRAYPKIWKKSISGTKKKIAFGFCGNARVENAIFYTDLPKKNINVNEHFYIHNILRPILIKSLLDEGVIIHGEDGNFLMGNSSFLIVFDGEIYGFDNDLSLHNFGSPYYALGEGAEYASGILEYIYRTSDVNNKLSLPQSDTMQNIMLAVESICPLVCGPFDYLEIKNEE